MYNKKICTAALLHNKSASTGISRDNFCAQGHDRRYTLYDVNLLPPQSSCSLLRASSFNGGLSKHAMFNHSRILMPLQKKISRLAYQEWNPIIKLIQCWYKESRFLEDQDGQREEGHYERTQYRLTYN